MCVLCFFSCSGPALTCLLDASVARGDATKAMVSFFLIHAVTKYIKYQTDQTDSWCLNALVNV